jgi:hypothetical protein
VRPAANELADNKTLSFVILNAVKNLKDISLCSI